MKLNCWLMLGVMVATSATAQNSTNSLPAMPPPITGGAMEVPAPAPALTAPAEVQTNAPAKKTVKKKKKKAAKTKVAKAAFTEPTATLAPGPAEVAVNKVNVRGQAGLKGEVITHVQMGDTVTILNQITLDKHKAYEPAQWAEISLPTNINVWVDSKFIDATNKTVTVKKLNLRAGPGENYSVLGVIEKGDSISEEGAKGDWTKIDAPTNAYAFIAAMYLKQEASGNVPVNPPPSTETPAPTPTTVTETEPMVAPAPTGVPTAADTTTATAPAENPMVIIQTNIVVVADTNVPPPPPRVVTHEGTVRSSVSIVAPTYFELYNPEDGKAINYLYSTTTNLNLVRYKGLHISVTGEEGLDERWPTTPVLTVQKIYVLTNGSAMELPDAAPAAAPVKKPWYYLGL